VWDLQTKQLKATSQGIEAYINAVAMNPVGATCVSASWDDSLRCAALRVWVYVGVGVGPTTHSAQHVWVWVGV